MTSIVVVESPAKAKTINKFLGANYQVVATYGHIRDLPSKRGSVSPDDGFMMKYQVSKGSARHVESLVTAAKQADEILLATDPDREGEAISWHVMEVLKKKGLDLPVRRVVFHEITKQAIQGAVAAPRDIDMDMVNAQQARRALDYLVGFNLSPLLWKKVMRGLSAGRVQSVALRLVCEREKEINAFEPREYWSIVADVIKGNAPADTPADPEENRPFQARLTVADGNTLGKFDIPDEATATRMVKAIEGQPLFINDIKKKQTRRNPAPPFITSTLQQEAFRKLGFSAKKTMTLAQRLYEGREIPTADGGKEVVGLITYMRTDSVTLATEAISTIRDVIKSRYGTEYLPKTPRKFKSSAKNAQEAHEAIRPTDHARTPEQLKATLEKDQYRLYELIWRRTTACQMAPARINQVAAIISVGENSAETPYQLRATGSSVAFPGFRKVYSEGRDEVSAQDRKEDDSERMLPPLEAGDSLNQKEITPTQHFTEPPPRYTEATLVKALESYGIGRPSTYAPIMSTIQERRYVRLENRKFHPEDVGMVVNDYLVEHFANYVDYNFTAHLENDLDAISRGEKTWIPVLNEFWKPFIDTVTEKDKTTKKKDEITDEKCPECEKPLAIKLGRFGRFYACTGYPECRYTRNIPKAGEEDRPEPAEPVMSEEKCDKCGAQMLIKEGRYGKYLACSAFPKCRNNQPLEKPKDTGSAGPECGKGTFLEKKSRRGKIFYSCSTYPKCKKAIWDKPLATPCPKCGAPFLTEKVTKRRGTEHICVVEGCDHVEVVIPPEKKAPAKKKAPARKAPARKTATKTAAAKKTTTRKRAAAKKVAAE